MKEADKFESELNALYKKGQNEEILKRIADKFPSIEGMPASILMIKGWAHYRRKEYQDAKDAWTLAINKEDSLRAWEGMAQLAAYVLKQDHIVAAAANKVPNSSSVCNAYAIRARDKDSNISVAMIVDAALRMFNTPEIGAVNLLNNTARLLIEKPREQSDLLLALGFFHAALAKYGEDKNYHHRAGVWYWISVIYEKLGDQSLAANAAKESFQLWQTQATLAPDNQSFIEKLERARKRLEAFLA